MTVKSLADIAKLRKQKVNTVTVPDWGTEVSLKEMDAVGMELFLALCGKDGNFSIDAICQVIALHMCTPDGERLFDAGNLNDAVKELKQHKHTAIHFLFSESLKVSGLTADEVAEEAKK